MRQDNSCIKVAILKNDHGNPKERPPQWFLDLFAILYYKRSSKLLHSHDFVVNTIGKISLVFVHKK